MKSAIQIILNYKHLINMMLLYATYGGRWLWWALTDEAVLPETLVQRCGMENADELWMQVKGFSRSLLKLSIQYSVTLKSELTWRILETLGDTAGHGRGFLWLQILSQKNDIFWGYYSVWVCILTLLLTVPCYPSFQRDVGSLQRCQPQCTAPV